MKHSLYEIKYNGLTAMIFAQTKKKAIKFFKESFGSLPQIDEENQWNSEGWSDELGFEVTHMGSNPKDWTLDDEPLLVSLNYRYQD